MNRFLRFLTKWLTPGPCLRCRWIGGEEADLSRSFRLLTGGRGLHKVHICVVFTYSFGFFMLYFDYSDEEDEDEDDGHNDEEDDTDGTGEDEEENDEGDEEDEDMEEFEEDNDPIRSKKKQY